MHMVEYISLFSASLALFLLGHLLAKVTEKDGISITVPPGAILLLPPGQTITNLYVTGGSVRMSEDKSDPPPDVKEFLERQKTVSAGAAREKSSPSGKPPASA